MAAETFRIEIPITVSDNTDPGVSSAKKKVTAFDEANKKTKKRLDEMNKTKWKVAVEAVDKVTSVISKIGKTVKGVAGKAWSFTVSAIDKVTQPVKKMISVMGDLLGVSSAVSTVLAGLTVKNALQASADMARMQAQLKVSAGNMGINESGIDAIIKKAEAMQKTTMYTDEAMVGSAAELATYFDDVDAITRMMDVVADYAAGMSGGVELSTNEIVDYTTNLAKMTTGAYDAMTKKGFEVTDAQKKILDSGTDMEKVAVIESIIKENWEGMAEAMANTPTGYLTKMKNAWDQISGTIGDKLTPGFTSLYKMIYSKMPGIEKILVRIAEAAGTWVEDFVPTLSDWMDAAIEKVNAFADRASEVFSSDEFKNSDFFGKIKISWQKLIAEPFSEWWESTGRAWFAGKMSRVGETIGTGLTSGLLALLGIDLSQTVEDGTSVGGAFIQGFKKGFDTEKITEALKEWADKNKEIVIAIGAVVGFNLITGIAGKLNDLTTLIKNHKKDSGGSGGAGGLGDLVTNCSTATVNGTIVNVYGQKVNDLRSGSGSGLGNALKNFLPSLGGAAVGGKLLTSGGKFLLGSGASTPLLTGGAAAGGTAAATGLTSAGSWLSSLLQLGSTSSVIGADGTLLAVQGGLGGTLGSIGGALGSTATTAAGAAAAGAAGTGGIIGGVLGLGSSLINLFKGIGKSKEGDKKGAQDEYWKSGTKAGMVGAGAAVGAGIGSVVPGLGTAIGALVGAGVGGIGALLGGDAAGKALSDGSDEGGWLNNAWQATKKFFKEDLGKFFTETIPEKWDEMWSAIGNFFTEDVPYAIGYACGKIEVFFTQTVPDFFTDLWDGISTFFTDTLPTWASNIWNNNIVPFFTQTIPNFFSEVWNGVKKLFTEAIPTLAANIWNSISGWFSSIGDWFGDVWAKVKGAFGAGYSDATGKHAWGGIMNSPHVGMVAEQGPEAIIPLSPSKSARGLDLWMKAGQYLGVQPYADGDIVGDTSTLTSETVTTGAGGNHFDIKLEINPEFILEGTSGMDEESIVRLIKARIREMVDDIGDELAEKLARIFANMPVKGSA